MGWLVFTVLILAAVAAFLAWTRYWERGPCPSCQGHRGRGWGSRPGAYRRCPKCGGSGERIRPLSLIWPCWREEAERQKEARRK